jgi:tRNA pseudouridine55 synthase
MSEDKEYSGTMKLGVVTDSQDAEGKILETHLVPSLDHVTLEAAFKKYDGDFYQIPPMVSAIKKEGVPLYKLARAGKIVEREPRFVRVYAHEILGERSDEVDFRVVCSKGFYVRTYVHDIGQDLGCGAHLQSLRRTKSGRFSVDRAFPAALLKQTPREELLGRVLSLPEVSRLRGA